mgnify:CR=1 FL=1
MTDAHEPGSRHQRLYMEIVMWARILSVFASLFEMWNKLNDETKDKIISSVVDLFTDIFRQQYQSSKEKPEEGEPA